MSAIVAAFSLLQGHTCSSAEHGSIRGRPVNIRSPSRVLPRYCPSRTSQSHHQFLELLAVHEAASSIRLAHIHIIGAWAYANHSMILGRRYHFHFLARYRYWYVQTSQEVNWTGRRKSTHNFIPPTQWWRSMVRNWKYEIQWDAASKQQQFTDNYNPNHITERVFNDDTRGPSILIW